MTLVAVIDFNSILSQSSMFSVPATSPETKTKLNTVLQYVLDNPHSSYYRDRFAAFATVTTPIETVSEWTKFPLLEREHVTSVPIKNRTFVPRSEVHTVRYTGSTSGKYPIITPRRIVEDYAATPKLVGVQRQASLLRGIFLSELSRRKYGGNIFNLPYPDSPVEYRAVAKMVDMFEADSLCGYPCVLVALAPYLNQAARQKITSIELCGERCSDMQKRALKELYDDPVLFQNYSLSEVSGVFGTACAEMLRERDISFHLSTHNIFSEFIDPDTGDTADPRVAPAELVVSSLDSSQPFPLIRYRTGDLLKVTQESCACGGGARFEMVGRAAYDRIRFMSGGIHLAQLERALEEFESKITPEFEAHFFESAAIEKEVHGQLEIRIVPRPGMVLDLPAMAQTISQTLAIGPEKVYADAVSTGWLLPIKVSLLKTPTRNTSRKRRYLFRHG